MNQPPVIDPAAYEAGRRHFAKHGFGGPLQTCMEEAWVRYGWILPPPERTMDRMLFWPSATFSTQTANHLYSKHWDFASWEKGVVDAVSEAHAEYLARQVQPTDPAA